jgi:alkylation response protein AidB-like acyl-CoA dehydrogenase
VDLELSDEQRWLREAVDELLEREPAERLWPALLEFGALGEELGLVERALVAHGLGAALAAVPYVDSAAAHYALDVLPEGASAAVCIGEPARTFAPTEPATTLESGALVGDKAGVAFAASVDLLAISAADPDGLVIVLLPPAAAAAVEPETSLDPSLELAAVRLAGAEPTAVASADVELLAAAGGVLAAAEAVGSAARVLGLACEYAAQRRQFGRTIGSFQAVRHLLADMHVKVESSWSSVLYAAASLDEAHDDRLRTASIAKAFSARATREVAHDALQVFGGVAFTAEHPAHRYLRRIVARGGQFGTAAEHERSLGRSLARTPAGVT